MTYINKYASERDSSFHTVTTKDKKEFHGKRNQNNFLTSILLINIFGLGYKDMWNISSIVKERNDKETLCGRCMHRKMVSETL